MEPVIEYHLGFKAKVFNVTKACHDYYAMGRFRDRVFSRQKEDGQYQIKFAFRETEEREMRKDNIWLTDIAE